MTEYTLKRSKRKTVAIHIIDGKVEVRAPLNLPKRDIDNYVASKQKWISDKLEQSNERKRAKESFALDYGSQVAYRGRRYPLKAKKGNLVGFDGLCFYMPPNLSSAQISDACAKLYRMLAKLVLTEKTLEFAKVMSLTPSSIKVNGAKTRWGSCSTLKSINYSWRLMMADNDVIDYVVVHELAHIIEPNHSYRFWAVVEGVLPDYRERKAKLKELQRRIAHENWD